MPALTLRGNSITLAQAIKASGLADTGGRAKHLIRNGQVLVNGQLDSRPGRKLNAGDRFQVAGGAEWVLQAAERS